MTMSFLQSAHSTLKSSSKRTFSTGLQLIEGTAPSLPLMKGFDYTYIMNHDDTDDNREYTRIYTINDTIQGSDLTIVISGGSITMTTSEASSKNLWYNIPYYDQSKIQFDFWLCAFGTQTVQLLSFCRQCLRLTFSVIQDCFFLCEDQHILGV